MKLKNLLKKVLPRPLLNFRHLSYAWLGAFKYKHPSEEILVIGVTGTSGKSSTIYFLRQVLEDAGLKVGALSTIEFCVAGRCELNDRKMTMLGRMEIQRYLREMVNQKCDVAVIETTSEGRLQYRHKFVNYDIMVLTNLYPEHIEAHGSFERYKQAKLDIFEHVAKKQKSKKTKKQTKTAIVNRQSECKNDFFKFGFDKKLTFSASDVTADTEGIRFKVGEYVFHPRVYGEYNASNLAAVVSIARELDIDWPAIQRAINELKGVPGRIEFIPEAKKYGFDVIVDYAFEPVAMNELYKVVDILETKRIIHVFGSTGGGRDIARRTTVGRYVGQKANIVIVTDEDPYDDDPAEIIEDVARAVAEVGKIEGKNLSKILDRRKAILKAVKMAGSGDIILITGKGSEQKMCLSGGKMINWDDRQVAKEALSKLKR